MYRYAPSRKQCDQTHSRIPGRSHEGGQLRVVFRCHRGQDGVQRGQSLRRTTSRVCECNRGGHERMIRVWDVRRGFCNAGLDDITCVKLVTAFASQSPVWKNDGFHTCGKRAYELRWTRVAGSVWQRLRMRSLCMVTQAQCNMAASFWLTAASTTWLFWTCRSDSG